MKNTINNKLDIIEKANRWVKETETMKGPKGNAAYRNFVNFRRQLNKKKYALEDNPAAAIYGESQVGKSYLVSSLLSRKGESFNVIDGNDNKYDFIRKINPAGGGVESTSLVTRFSTSYKWHNPDFPIKAKLLTPADLILVLCDTYYNDVKIKVDGTLKTEGINEEVDVFIEKFKSNSKAHTLLREDDIYDIQDYFKTNFATKASNVIHSNFFEEIALHIENVNYTEWSNMFSVLWNKNEKLTKLLHELLLQYEVLDFQTEVYLPIKSVLRDYGTLLDVARMYEIYGDHQGIETNYEGNTPVLIIKDGKEEIRESYSKPYLCALAAELLFSLSPELEEEKPFLKNTDLLDFPGSRHRLQTNEEDVEDKIIPQMLLRGKVAYLFNKYSYSEKINILLFCHHDLKSTQGSMPEALNNWVSEMIGDTVENRESFIDMSKIPPLFIVSTMFNKDLAFNLDSDVALNQDSLDIRWHKRFERVLEKEIFGVDTYTWFKQWTVSNSNFQNIYLLRDYYHSSDLESKIYIGYNESKVEVEEIEPRQYPEFREDLRKSFTEYNFVKEHFKNPEKAWQEAVDKNKDGSQLIIDNLEIAAENINEARSNKIKKETKAIGKGILNELKKYYHDADSDNRLQQAKSKAGTLQSSLDITFGKDPYFFGMMIQNLMIKESDVYILYLDKMKDIEKRDLGNGDVYSPIRRKVESLNSKDSLELNLQRLSEAYNYASVKECQEDFESKGVDIQELFYGANQRVMRFSQVLAEHLEEYFFETHLRNNTNKLLETFSNEEVQDLYDMLHTLFKKLKVSSRISQRIRKYVDDNHNVDAVYGMIADLSAEIINKFINTVGLEYYTQTDYEDLELANDKNKLGLVLDHSKLDFDEITTEGASKLFETLGNLPELINHNPLPNEVERLPNYQYYLKWRDRVKTGFVSVCDIPNYDVQANKKLGHVIEEFKLEY